MQVLQIRAQAGNQGGGDTWQGKTKKTKTRVWMRHSGLKQDVATSEGGNWTKQKQAGWRTLKATKVITSIVFVLCGRENNTCPVHMAGCAAMPVHWVSQKPARLERWSDAVKGRWTEAGFWQSRESPRVKCQPVSERWPPSKPRAPPTAPPCEVGCVFAPRTEIGLLTLSTMMQKKKKGKWKRQCRLWLLLFAWWSVWHGGGVKHLLCSRCAGGGRHRWL